MQLQNEQHSRMLQNQITFTFCSSLNTCPCLSGTTMYGICSTFLPSKYSNDRSAVFTQSDQELQKRLIQFRRQQNPWIRNLESMQLACWMNVLGFRLAFYSAQSRSDAHKLFL